MKNITSTTHSADNITETLFNCKVEDAVLTDAVRREIVVPAAESVAAAASDWRDDYD